MHVSLVPHPGTADGPVTSIEVTVRREGGRIGLTYWVRGDTERVLWPRIEGLVSIEGLRAAGRADELWRHTCFEAFVLADDGYREFNFATSGKWASYAFSGYREGMSPARETAELVSLEGRAGYRDVGFIADLPDGARRLGLSAVIEDMDGGFSYWALAHPSAKPDFHHPDSFVLELP